ncbi:MAG TPA: alpha/beta hydrolase [Candidatus Babeliales bacterium]|jgi:alpha-beta hydrolase superfamily lysophospholipase|nr:alpha/beta hydrolase [Candidatus Babeliales bacterium]
MFKIIVPISIIAVLIAIIYYSVHIKNKKVKSLSFPTRIMFKDEDFNFQLLRALDHATQKGSEVGECMATASSIIDGDYQSWYTQWYNLAERIYTSAQDSEQKGHTMSACDAYLRASNYYRTAYFFLRDNLDDSRLLDAFNKQEASFKYAIPYLPYIIETIAIPYKNTMLSGYIHYPQKKNDNHTLVIFPCGSDSTKEEHYFFGAKALIERGYTVVVFDGPGQGDALFRKKLFFVPEWQLVLQAVLAHIDSLPHIKTKKLVLLGRSYASYFVLRAAALNKRVTACIVDPGAWSVYDAIINKIPLAIRPTFEYIADSMITHMPKASVFKLMSMAASHGTSSIQEFIHKSKEYSIEPYASKITCPVLVCSAEHEFFNAGQAETLYKHLQCPKKYIEFKASEGADNHCEMGASALFYQRAFDWLDEIIQ